MANILVSPEELRSHANNVSTRAQSTQADFNTLRAQLQALSSAFQGQAATAFQTHYEQWHSSAVNLVTALDGLGRFLNNSATTIETTDQQLASGLG